MYEVIAYHDESDKDARIKLKKILEYIGQLKACGLHAGLPAVKHLTGTVLWELRPASDRIIFAYWKDNIFILLHHFVKKSQRTPPNETWLTFLKGVFQHEFEY